MPTSRTALLVMDMQNEIVERYADDALVQGLASAIAAGREHAIQVIYVQVGFREGYPEVSRRNLSFGRIAESGRFGSPDGAAIHPGVAPVAGEIVVTKRRVSGFAGSDLDVVLRSREIEHLVLTGIATSGVVLSTLRQAADLDFVLTVLSDGCCDADDEVHRVLTEKVFRRQARVITISEWIGSLG